MDDVGLLLERCAQCLGLFAICRACYRGQVYCVSAHQVTARDAQVRAAKARHRRSPEGRADNRDHNRAWRARQRTARDRVRDQGSAEVAPSGSVCPPEDPPTSMDDVHVIVGERPDDAVRPQDQPEAGPDRRRWARQGRLAAALLATPAPAVDAPHDAGRVAPGVGARCQHCHRTGLVVTAWPRFR